MLNLIALLAVSQVAGNVEVPLSSLDLSAVTQGYGRPGKDITVDRNPLRIAGTTYPSGLGTHAESQLTVRLDKKAVRFRAKVGVDDETEGKGSVVFRVAKDGKIAWESGPMKGNDPAKDVDVDLKGAKLLELSVGDAGDGIDHDHADWVEATIVTVPGAKLATIGKPAEKTMKIASYKRDQTEIHGPRIVGGTPGRDFLFLIPATGKGPLAYSAKNLPDGLVLDPKTGVISGQMREAGTTDAAIAVKGPKGTAKRTIRFVAGANKLALTPPLGWNSWNVWGLSVSADKVRDAAKSFIETGLAGYGYQYINIDDGWEAEKRAENGEIVTNDKFPDMKGLADDVHRMGLKLGIYSSPGPRTCGGYLGSYQHEYQDAQSYADWGIDYLKYDWCSYGSIAPNPNLAELKKPYILMREALDRAGRDIVYSLCQYGMGEVWKWGNTVGADCWRTTGDITDTWGSMAGIGFSQGKIAKYTKPSGWNDPDMLVVGRLGWGPNVRENRLTENEQITHITLWAMLASPFLIGCDLTRMDEFTHNVLMNHEVLEIQQDPAGIGAVQRVMPDGSEVWTRKLWDGTTAVALFNKAPVAKEIRVGWPSIGIDGTPKVLDCWLRKDLGQLSYGIRRTVPGHGAMVFKVGTPKPLW